MITWSTIRPGILALLATLTEIPPSNITWDDQPLGYLNPGDGMNPPVLGDRAQLLCSIRDVQAQGQDSCATVFRGFSTAVVASKLQGTVTAGQPLWFTEAPPAPFVTNTQYFARDVSGATFSLAATLGGAAIAPASSSSSGAVLATVAPGTELVDVYSGIRLFVLQVRCESYEQEDGLTAYQYLEELRSRLWRKSSVDALLALNVCAYETNDQTQAVPTVADDRVVSAAVLALHLRAGVDEPGDAYGYIASATLTQQVTS